MEFDEDVFALEKPVSQKQLADLIEKYHLATDVEQIKPMLRTIAPPDYNEAFVPHLLWVDGKLNRFEVGNQLFIDDPDYSIRYNSFNKTIDLFSRGSALFRFRELSELRDFPAESLTMPQLTGTSANTIHMVTHDTAELSGSPREIITDYDFDWQTGLPTHLLRRVAGNPIREIYQLQITQFEGGGPFPLVLVDAVYDWQNPARGLITLSIIRLHSARFQIPIPAEKFILPKPEKVEVLDRRLPDTAYCLYVGDVRTDDVRKLLPAQPGANQPGKPAMSWPRRILYVINGVALIVLGVWLWRKVSLKDPKH